MLNWRNLSAGVLVLAASGASAPAFAIEEQGYPAKPIRLIAPFAPGGGATQVARMIVPELADLLGQSIVVDNRPGGGGMVGTEIAARSQPDGYTLVMGTVSNIVINPLLSKAPYDPVRDLIAIIHTSTVPLVLVVHPSVAAKSVKELIELARSSPAKLNFASSGEGTVGHLAGELFKSTAGVNLVHVPYRGGGPAVIDLVGGHVQLGFINIIEALPQVNGGRLRALAVSTTKRSPVSPALPTIAEAGVPGYEVVQWSGVFGPAGVPKGVVSRLNRDIAKILTGSELRQHLIASGAEPGGDTPAQFSALVKSDIWKWSRIIKTARLEHVR